MNSDALARQASMLGGRIKQQKDAYVTMLRPAGVPVFHTKQSEQDALALWRKAFAHPGEPWAQALFASKEPADLLDVQTRLARSVEPTTLDGSSGMGQL